MIDLFFFNPKNKISKPVWTPHKHSNGHTNSIVNPTYPPEIYKLAAVHKIPPIEAKRRDDVIKKYYNTCLVFVGDKLTPKNEDKQKQYGVCTVTHIAKDLKEYGDTDWPTITDNPMIIQFHSSVTNQEIVCTTNFFNPPDRVTITGPAC